MIRLSTTTGLQLRSKNYLRLIRDLRRQAPGSVRPAIHVRSTREFVHRAAPELVLARLFGGRAKIHLELTSSDGFAVAIGPLGRTILRLADSIVVPTYRISHQLAAFDITTVVEGQSCDCRAVVTRLVTDIQPRLLVYSSEDWPQNLPLIVSAFEQIQQKYPRAELTFAGPDPAIRSLMVSQFLRGRLHVHQTDDPAEFARLCRDHDTFLATASCDMTPDHLILALATGLPAIFPPVGDVRPATELALLRSETEPRFVRHRIVDTVLRLVESSELAAAMSRYSQLIRSADSYQSHACPPWRLTG